MKKRILFLISSLDSGGVSKSMVSLLNVIDRENYEVSLWVASPHGIFLTQVPSDVHMLTDERIELLAKGASGVLPLLRGGHLLLALGSVVRMALSTVSKSWSGRLLAVLFPAIGEGEYDLIVDYNGQHQLYYMVNKLRGKKKASFFHSDYSKWPFYYAADKEYYPHVDAIFSISPHCVEVLKQWFPTQASKIHLMENITSPLLINKMADETIPSPWHSDVLRLVSLGHVTDNKGSHWAIEAAHLLKEQGLAFHWIFVGGVGDAPRYDAMVEKWGLQSYITFAGVQANPYPYVKSADIVVHPSQFEGKSIALDEAKLLCKPIVVTNFSTVGDQFENGVNATICEMTPSSIAEAIAQLAKDVDLRMRYVTCLRQHMADNSSEVTKLYNLIND